MRDFVARSLKEWKNVQYSVGFDVGVDRGRLLLSKRRLGSLI